MTDEEKITAVTAKLAGEFYIGQRVRIGQKHPLRAGDVGTVHAVHREIGQVDVLLEDGHSWLFWESHVWPI